MSEVIFKYFPDLSQEQQEQFSALKALYLDWNEKINVISRKDTDSFYEKHVLHSLGIAKVTSFVPGTMILDVGTGGGFPGIPLAILFPEVNFHLVDSIGKKIAVVSDVAKQLGLENVKAEQIRAEELKLRYDFIVSRAVTNIVDFYTWVKDKVRPEQMNDFSNGILYLKGGDLTEELAPFKRKYHLFDLKEYFSEEFFETKKVLYVPIGK